MLDRPLTQKLLGVMDQKHHWVYPYLTKPGLSRAELLAHFRHEYLVFVRDFPWLLARAYGTVPPLFDVRRALAENIFEEETGGLSKTAPHPELFLRMMRGLGFSEKDFEEDESWLHPAAIAYRDYLRSVSRAEPWQNAVALLTIWVEGSINERGELSGTFTRKKGEDAVATHAMVVHYGCPKEAMTLVRAHGEIEGAHRKDAWQMIAEHVPDQGKLFEGVVSTVSKGHALWMAYRDGVGERMGLKRPATVAA